jgi:hypothetical protein
MMAKVRKARRNRSNKFVSASSRNQQASSLRSPDLRPARRHYNKEKSPPSDKIRAGFHLA